MDIELLLDDKGKVITPPENIVDSMANLELARVTYICYRHGIHPRGSTRGSTAGDAEPRLCLRGAIGLGVAMQD